MVENQQIQATLPFSLFDKENSNSEFSKNALIVFKSKENYSIKVKQFEFNQSTLAKKELLQVKDTEVGKSLNLETSIPVFSLLSVLLLIIFRNRFFTSFQKYFLSVKNNYEIDFNLQKIGASPVILALAVIFFSALDLSDMFFKNFGITINTKIEAIKIVLIFLSVPIISSILLIIVLNLSLKLFPIIFSDLKSLFILSLIGLSYNFLVFGSNIENEISFKTFFLILCGLFLVFRSFLMFKIFQKSYRFKFPITVFYICTLNLQTFLFVTWGASKELFRLL
jgi:hypothetical protein